MRNRFTITISDVHGARHYSFSQLAKRFVGWLMIVMALAWVIGGLTVWWFSHKVDQVEEQHKFAVKAYSDRLAKTQQDYDQMLAEKTELEETLNQRSEHLDTLDQTLQNIEELMLSKDDLQSMENVPFEQRLQNLQMNSLERSLMLTAIPNGPAVRNFKGLTSFYGERKNPVTGVRRMHSGIDYRAERGEDVIATADGIVSFSAFSQETGYGNLVAITHADGFKTRYGHLDKRVVKVGDYVYKGDKIGEVGNTGRSSGAHLHYEVLFLSHRLDPKPFHEWTQKNYKAIFKEVKLVPWGSLVQAVSFQAKKVEKQLLPQGATSKVNLTGSKVSYTTTD
ncbi:peptidase [Thiosulfatimonas sediminis]|uniref:Peptidase n=1 Tax=Thiosulfatimonas sediminis TaxID=2675054 RepID=A0A6F8PW88_9GAMM|nr:M23 family metallopeptidase [Thiosulfatimonas sediminis]BBP46385.1 peptidase [Thiosulfatimonas sediminis]